MDDKLNPDVAKIAAYMAQHGAKATLLNALGDLFKLAGQALEAKHGSDRNRNLGHGPGARGRRPS